MRLRLAVAAGALTLVGTLAAEPAAPQGAATAQDGMNHAAVVVDTGDGVVRKMCLAFPEAEISGIEALRRVDTRPNRFEAFAGKGSGVCMLCGVGCPSGDCFCDPNRYWAYHRAGPGEPAYRVSSLGASSTVVRDGDVEAWRWGAGQAPPKTTVSEVCQVPEPTPRTTQSTTTQPPTPTTDPPSPAPTAATGSPTSTTPPTPAPTAPRPPGQPQPTTTSSPLAAGTPTSEPPEAAASDVEEEAAAPAAAEVKRSLGAEDGAAAATTDNTEPTASAGQLASLAAFTALLAALLVWRSRLRRAKVRRVRPVR